MIPKETSPLQARHIDGGAPANPSERLEWIEARKTVVSRAVLEAMSREDRALTELETAKRRHAAAKARFAATDAPDDWARMSDAEQEQHRLDVLHAAASRRLVEARRGAADELREAQRARLEEIRPALERTAMLDICKPHQLRLREVLLAYAQARAAIIETASEMAMLAVEAKELARATGAQPPPRLDWADLFEAAVATDMLEHAELILELRAQFVPRTEAELSSFVSAKNGIDLARELGGLPEQVRLAVAQAAVARLPVDASESDRTTAIQLAVAEAAAAIEPRPISR